MRIVKSSFLNYKKEKQKKTRDDRRTLLCQGGNISIDWNDADNKMESSWNCFCAYK